MRRSWRRASTAAAVVATAVLAPGCAGGCPPAPTPSQMHQAHVGDYALGLIGVMFAVSLIGWLACYVAWGPRRNRPAAAVLNAIDACNVLFAVLGVGLPMVVAFASIQGSSNGDCGPTAAGTQSFINSVEVLAAALVVFGIAFSGLGTYVLTREAEADRRWGIAMVAVGVALLIPTIFVALL